MTAAGEGAPTGAPHGLVVMGVSSSGKSTLAETFAQRFGWVFRDGDSFHSPQNIAKMSAGIALTDEDRWPWLRSIAAWLVETRQAGGHGVVACSALKRAYRDILVGGEPDEVRIVYLEGSREVIGARMAKRRHHYMPESLLDSQFATLEPPAPDERPITLSVEATPEAMLDRLAAALEAKAP
ncbi:gluconokinase [Enterovirga rhinocerotis]|uniref:Gluconokinase n=1 Tax=Enterovirga rhinocerotis TaxID=1339210 RepID=A0A4R7BVY2_9HYPH|nr:gluconokinase [Enterovirga rhinocerotis]TDR90014.1 gluconate kinase (SKI family) [Enterovirga rhinocerotis]